MSNPKDPVLTSQFRSDQPIRNAGEDKLNRAGFALHLARAIGQWKGQESLVVALYGSWGIGKSSLKNLVLEQLKTQGGHNPLVADLNVWEFANRDRITATFFDQIGLALGRGDIESGSVRKAAARRWKAYAAYLTSARDIVGQLQSAGVGLTFALGISLFGLSFALSQSWIPRALGLALVIGAGLLRWSAGFATAVAQGLTARAENVRSLREVKESVQADINALGRPLMVVLDDLDRLTPAETIEVLQLVKANADFRGLVYFILCDRPVIEGHIAEALKVSGRDYLEKIVQVAFTVPPLDTEDATRILFEGLNQILDGPGVSKRFDQTRWGNLYQGGLRPYFRNLRDVNRFVSTLGFHVGVFANEGGLEVNPIDLIGLEVLRVFEPEFYGALPEAKDLLTNEDYSWGNSRDRSDQRKKSAEALISKASLAQRSSAQEILTQLFPRVQRHFGGTHYAPGFEDGWSREGRVCVPELFDRYFAFTIPAGDIAQSTIDRLVTLAGDRAGLTAELEGLAKQDLLTVALSRLEAYKEQLPLEASLPLITSLFDIGDALPRRTGFMFENSGAVSATRVILWHLRREPSVETRFSVLTQAIKDTTGFFLPLDFVATLAQAAAKKEEAPKSLDDTLVDEGSIESLKKQCLHLLGVASADGRLAGSPELLMLLYLWRNWAGEDAPKAFCASLCQSPDGAMQMVRAFEQTMTSQSISDRVAKQTWYIRLGNIERFADPAELEKALTQIDSATLSETDRRAFDNFAAAMQRRREGKPDIGGPRTDID
jgi:predicted KAP-like P-loop ATPase